MGAVCRGGRDEDVQEGGRGGRAGGGPPQGHPSGLRGHRQRTLPFFLHSRYSTNCLSELRSRSRWSRNYLRPGAEAEIIFLINIYISQFRGCQDEEKLILRLTVFLIVLLL